MLESPRTILEELYRTAVAAVEPRATVRRALDRVSLDPARRLFILAIGKAATGMAAGALESALARGHPPVGGLVIGSEDGAPSTPPFDNLAGDHPIPSRRSLEAARRLEGFVARVRPDDQVWVLLSGGTSSLIAAPVEGVSPDDLIALYEKLLGSGLDITQMNLVRKRFSRWGAGRLAQALAPAEVRVRAISDVPGDDLADIGSGPCSPDRSSASDIMELIGASGLARDLPPALREHLSRVESGTAAETLKPGDPLFQTIESQVIATNRTALLAAAERARARDLECTVMEPLRGDAARAGTSIGNRLCMEHQGQGIRCFLWGGETTVTLGPSPGHGGRNQELALAAALAIAGDDSARSRITLLAAGTDGRDGPTDAAGAVVDGQTVPAIRRARLDPYDCLKRHDTYSALEEAGALLKVGPTGTNVMDIVIALVLSPAPPPAADSWLATDGPLER